MIFGAHPGPNPELGYCYRYREVRYSPGADDWGDPIPRAAGEHLGIWINEYPVLRMTPHGFWFLDHYEDRERFVNLSWTKQYAHRTKEAARDAFIERKRKQIRILHNTIIDAQELLRMALEQKSLGVAHQVVR
ncbi:TPA: hypothetical protein ACP7Q5_004941 [Escherichia coli]|jgi:hypothetical protein|uniref:Uncharacterized protein n=10 Tax=root TaxID=1 RepID=A0A8S5UI37_9CAUD|nr:MULTISPECIES: hypothetical protein [Enterococcus]ELG7156205.1 hypothetical protein [Staphylococcus aureus]DAF94092.1 MAG TPA: hypothetical protein [Myoviridae sp. ctu2j3]ELL1201304.1 hypothetical protein [Staphylococcus aureus]MDN3040609.1 hypothetical protein [Enterococcus faecium]MDN3079910.1 hypothetical protein [Enterococcus faecium]